mgnify:CR=1 FL=1
MEFEIVISQYELALLTRPGSGIFQFGTNTTSETVLGCGLVNNVLTTDISRPFVVDSMAEIYSPSTVTLVLSIIKVVPDNLYRFLSRPVMR